MIKRLVWCFLAALLLAGSARARAGVDYIRVEHDNFRLLINPIPLPRIPLSGPSGGLGGASYVDAMALMANAGNEMISGMRAAQDSLAWFLGEVEPLTSFGDTLVWPCGQTLLIIGRRNSAVARELWATNGSVLGQCPILEILPCRAIRFDEFVLYSSRGETKNRIALGVARPFEGELTGAVIVHGQANQ